MKLRSLFLLVIAAVLAAASPRRADAFEVSFSFFQDSLAPYGEWLEVGDYGYCWRPTGMDEDWAPYSDGYWAYTDGGWTWVSYEDFGGIVYHYGRWVRVEDEGWCWVPDYEWAPAWVSWRNNDDYIGWAPLPPEARWERNRGFGVWVDTSYDIAPSCYNFVRVVDFGAPVLRPWVCHRRDNFFYVQRTVNVTNVTFNTGAGCIFNGGPDFVRINRHVSRPIPALKLVQNTNITVVNNTIINNNVRVKNVNAVQQGNQLMVVAPKVIRPDAAQVTALVKPNVRRVIPQARVTKGWATMPAEERTAARTKFRQESKDLTPETAPARPVKVADLEVVPVKADPNAVSPVATRKDRPRPGMPTREKVTAGREPAVAPIAEQPAAIEKPANPRDAAKIAREKALTQKATPAPNAAEVVTTPAPIARERVKPARPDVTKPFNPAVSAEQPATVKTPEADDTAAKRAAAQQAAQDRERATAAAREKAAAQQEVVRQRQAAQETAKERASQQQQQQAVRERQMDIQAQEAARQRAAAAAQERQKVIQQQQEQSATRARVAEQQDAIRQRQAVQQSQEAARERNAQMAAQRQRAMESQQQQQAAQARAAQMNEARQRAAQQQQQQQQALAARQQAAERSQAQAVRQHAAQQQQQAQAAAQQQAIARAQAQNAARQQMPPQRQVAPPPQRQVVPQQRQAPPQRTVPGKRQLTPEEAAALQRQR